MVQRVAELGRADLDRERLDEVGRVGGDGVLGDAQVAEPGHADVGREPGLGRQPVEGRQAVGPLVAEGIELAARDPGAAHLLQDGLVAALGEQPGDQRRESAAAIGRSQEDDRKGFGGRLGGYRRQPRRAPHRAHRCGLRLAAGREEAVREQLDAVGHRGDEVALHLDPMRLRRREPADASRTAG